jgi:hypothetical protein
VQLVAITKWGTPLQQELPELAARLGMVAYDLRIKLAGALPVFYTTDADVQTARTHVDFLRGRGHGAVVCDLDAVPRSADMCVAKTFTLGPRELSGTDTNGGEFTLAYADVTSLIRVMCVRNEAVTVTTKEKKFSLGRAALSGGLVMTKAVEKQQSHTSQEREQVIYSFCGESSAPMMWREYGLHYGGLGKARDHSASRNFMTLLQELQQRCPQARYDDSMLTNKRRVDPTALGRGGAERHVEHSNERENELAAFVLHRAQLEGQL